MTKLGVVLGLALALFASAADARPHRHHAYVHRTTHYDRNFATRNDNIPADCRGMAWCGCWLRHQFGLGDTTLNLAAAWKRYPRVAPENANIVVWPSGHHVGKVLAVQGGKFQVISGNSGRGGVNTWWLPIRRGFSFHHV